MGNSKQYYGRYTKAVNLRLTPYMWGRLRDVAHTLEVSMVSLIRDLLAQAVNDPTHKADKGQK